MACVDLDPNDYVDELHDRVLREEAARRQLAGYSLEDLELIAKLLRQGEIHEAERELRSLIDEFYRRDLVSDFVRMKRGEHPFLRLVGGVMKVTTA